jgi:hypothetical protein
MKKALIVILMTGVALLTGSAMAQLSTPSGMEYWNVQPLPQVFVLPPDKSGLPLQITPDLPTNAVEPASIPTDTKVFLARPEPPVNVNPYTSPEYEAKVAEMDAHNRRLRQEFNATQQELYNK